MKKKSKIWLILLFLVLAVALLFAGLYAWQQMTQKTPDEILIQERLDTQEAYDTLLKESLLDRNRYEKIVVINPAHGGSDIGYRNDYGTEKEITLSIAQKVQENNTDSNTGIFLTRADDTSPDESMRLEFIQKMQPDLFIDIHVKRQGTECGTAVYYSTHYYDNLLTNATFADIMEKNVVTAVEGCAEGIFEDTQKAYPILSELSIPAVGLQCGNLSNETEGVLLTRENYQSNMADGILDAIYEALDRLEQ